MAKLRIWYVCPTKGLETPDPYIKTLHVALPFFKLVLLFRSSALYWPLAFFSTRQPGWQKGCFDLCGPKINDMKIFNRWPKIGVETVWQAPASRKVKQRKTKMSSKEVESNLLELHPQPAIFAFAIATASCSIFVYNIMFTSFPIIITSVPPRLSNDSAIYPVLSYLSNHFPLFWSQEALSSSPSWLIHSAEAATAANSF